MDYIEATSVLGLEQHCSIEEVEKSYKALASKYHPDKGGSHGDMVKVNEARNFLVSHLSTSNLPSVFKQLELSVLNMNLANQEHRALERKVEKIENDVKVTATSKLKSMKSAALVLATLSTGAFFLGKQIPKDLMTGFMPVALEKPLKVERPEVTENVAIYLASKNIEEKVKSEEIFLRLPKEIQNYLSQEKKYKEYAHELNIYSFIQEKIRNYTLIWHLFTFGLGLYAGVGAWFLNRKIQRVETELSELTTDLTIKAQYVEYLQDVFGDHSIDQWTLKDLENRISEFNFHNYSLRLIAGNIGPKKLAQLFIAKGQESSFLSVKHGDADNGYRETFRIA